MVVVLVFVLLAVLLLMGAELELGAITDVAFVGFEPEIVELETGIATAILAACCMDDTKDDIGLADMLIRGVAAAGNVNIWGWFGVPAMDAAMGGTMKNAPGTTALDGMAHMGTKP